jgi:DNA-binding transcriptional LysR family regulator
LNRPGLAGQDVLGHSLLATGDQWQFDGPDGPVSVKVRPRLWSNDGDSCNAACVQGAGIKLQPTFLIAEELLQGVLVEILPQFKAVTLGIYAVYQTRKFVLPKVRALVEFLDARLREVSWASL